MVSAAASLVATCLVQLALADAVPFYDLSVNSEARGRDRSGDPRSGEVLFGPTLSLGMGERNYELSASYLPQLFAQSDGVGLQTLHRASVAASWRGDRVWQMKGTATGSYGTNDLLLTPIDANAANPSAQALPKVTQLHYGALAATLGVDGRIAPRHQLHFTAAASTDGGLGAEAEKALPRQTIGKLTGGVSWEASRLDAVGATLATTYTGFTDGRNDKVIELTGSWRHVLMKAAAPAPERDLRVAQTDEVPDEPKVLGEVWLSLGAAADAHHDTGGTSWVPSVTGEVGIRGPLAGKSLEGGLVLRVAPQADRFTTSIYDRADTSLSLSWKPHRDWTLVGTGTGGLAFTGSEFGHEVLSADVHAGWVALASLEVVAGMRLWWQQEVTGISPAFHEWTTFVGFAYHYRDLF